MLINQIKEDQISARVNRDAIRAALLTTLYAEASIVGKNQNRQPTDDECIKVIQKFVKNIDETIAALPASDIRQAVAITEKEILGHYLPKMATADEIQLIINNLKASGVDNIGMIMKGLKDHFGSTLDGKLASQLAKQ